jgi:LPXTG-motif cell wall-anchored protein
VKSPRILATLLIAGALVSATALPAAAVTFVPIVPVAPDAGYPQISVDPATGNSLMVWQDVIDGTVYGQIVDSELAVVLPAVAISEDASQVAEEDSPPFAAWNSEDQTWLVVWDNDTQIWGRVFDATGPLGAASLISDHAIENVAATFTDIEQVEAAYSTTSNFYLVGFKARSEPQDCQEIFGILVTAAGSTFTTGASVLSSDAPGEDVPTAGCDVVANNGLGLDWAPTTNEWFVTWYSGNDDREVGRFIGVGFLVPAHASAVLDLGENASGGAGSVIYDPGNDQFLVAWYNQAVGGDELRGVYVLTDETVGASFGISDTSRDVRRPRLAYDAATATFLVVAHSPGSQGLSEVRLWELLAGSTTTVTTPQLVSLAAYSTRPVAAVANGCSIVIWQDLVPGAGEGDPDLNSVLGRSTCGTALLPATGSDSIALLGVAGGILALGAAAFALSRRRQSAV